MMREVMLITGDQPVNVVVVPDGERGDQQFAALGGAYDAVVDITDSDPKPGLGLGWTWDGADLLPPPPDPDLEA